jgi:hypothetical protein
MIRMQYLVSVIDDTPDSATSRSDHAGLRIDLNDRCRCTSRLAAVGL